jgi:hypothetical protein
MGKRPGFAFLWVFLAEVERRAPFSERTASSESSFVVAVYHMVSNYAEIFERPLNQISCFLVALMTSLQMRQ